MEIINFEEEYSEYFAELNLEWLNHYFWVENHDKTVLQNPKTYIIDNGGFIFFLKHQNQIIGTAAIMNEAHGWELSKMAIKPEFQGQGFGKKLLEHCISFAKAKNWESIMLYSNTKLKPAIKLYKKLGFVEIPLEKDNPYERADIKMELNL